MIKKGSKITIIFVHYCKSLSQARQNVLFGKPPVQKSSKYQVGIYRMFRLPEQTQSPIVIGRKTVAQIVGTSQSPGHYQGLVTHQHSSRSEERRVGKECRSRGSR